MTHIFSWSEALGTYELAQSIKEKSNINSVSLSKDKCTIANGLNSGNLTIHKYSPQTKSFEMFQELEGHTDKIMSVSMSSKQGEMIVTGSFDGSLRIWRSKESLIKNTLASTQENLSFFQCT